MNKRDDFSQKTIDTLCERVGGKCSNPNCRRETKRSPQLIHKKEYQLVRRHI